MSVIEHNPQFFDALLAKQRSFFAEGHTKPITFRLEALRRMRGWIEANEQALLDALKADLNKAPFEAYATEIGIVLEELRFALRHLRDWTHDRRVLPPLKQFPRVASYDMNHLASR